MPGGSAATTPGTDLDGGSRVKGKGQHSKDRLQWAQLAQSRRQEEEAEQDRHLVSWLLVLLWGWDLVESVELDSE